MKKGHAILVSLGLALLVTATPVWAGGQGALERHGKTFGEWSAAWWQWALSIPKASSPVILTDADPNFDCTLGQRETVFFLAGIGAQFAGFDNFISLSGERTCTVPHSQELFFPIVNAIFVNVVGETTCADGPLGGPCTVEEKRAILAQFSFVSFGCALDVTVDGVPLFTDAVARTQSPPFPVLIGPDDAFDFPEGSNDPEAVSDGFWVMLPPLARGPHELTLRGSLCSSQEIADPGAGAPFSLKPFFSLAVTYHLSAK